MVYFAGLIKYYDWMCTETVIRPDAAVDWTMDDGTLAFSPRKLIASWLQFIDQAWSSVRPRWSLQFVSA